MQWCSLFNKFFDGRSALCSVFSVRAWRQQEIPGLCCSVRFSFFSRLVFKVRMSLSFGWDNAVPITCLFWRVEGEITLPWWRVRSGSVAGLRSFFLRLTLSQAYEFRDFPAVVLSIEVIPILYGRERPFIDHDLSARTCEAPTVAVVWRGL